MCVLSQRLITIFPTPLDHINTLEQEENDIVTKHEHAIQSPSLQLHCEGLHTFKWIAHPKMKILSLITHPHGIPNL